MTYLRIAAAILLTFVLAGSASAHKTLPQQRLAVHLEDHTWVHPPNLARGEHVKLLRTIAAHDEWVIATGKTHPAKAVRFHGRELAHAKTKLRKLDRMSWCRQGACIVALIRRIWTEDPEGAVTVAWCESRWTTWDYNSGHYTGVFQLGDGERSRYGHVGSGIYASPEPSTAIRAPAWEQIVAAHHYFQVRGWYPWQCLPSGGLRW